MHCRICGKKSEKRACNNCSYLLEKGADEETIKRMLSNDEVKKVWKENEEISEELAYAYYDSVIENYKQSQIKNDSKENFGFNAYVDGIRLGLDIVLPMLDQGMQAKVKEKIDNMVKIRKSKK